MNASFSILQKLKNQFFQSVSNKSDYHVAFAPFAFTLSNDDFYFLKNNITTGSQARKYLKEQSEFAFIANSILKRPNIWAIDNDNLLYNSYKNILENALTIDPDVFSQEEITKIDDAKKVLFKPNGDNSLKYQQYKSYAIKATDIEKNIIELTALKNTIDPSDTLSLEKWNIDYTTINNQKKELLIEWQVKGFKSAVESAKSSYETVILSKINFIEKWNDAKNIKLSGSLLTDEYGVEFLSTTCVPNSICDYQSRIWKKLTLTKQEITQLSKTFTQEVPAEVLNEFGNIEPELESISFEYSIIDIQRPWFDESIINNRLWKYPDANQFISKGDDSMSGEIPAYPVKIILSKNIDLTFTPNTAVNEDIKNKLKNGSRLFFGPLLLKTIPLNLANESINSYKVQQLSNNELSVLTKVAVQKPGVILNAKETSKYKMIKMMNNQPQKIMRKNVEEKSVAPSINLSKMSTIKYVNPTLIKTAILANKPIKPAIAKPVNPRVLRALRMDRMIIKPIAVPVKPVTPSQPKVQIAKITGKIVDTANEPLPVTEIQLMNVKNASTQSVLSLEDGTYTIENIENGTYEFKIKKTGYLTIEKKMELTRDINFDFLLELEPVPTESFQVMGVICKKLPLLPNPLPENTYI
jgi:hypothetical protein